MNSFKRKFLLSLCASITFSLVTSSFVLGLNSLKPELDVKPVINKIVIEGCDHVGTDVLINRIPFKKGQPFDEKLTPVAINNLYDLGYFRQITVEIDEYGDDEADLYIVVEEKKLLEKFEFEGNKALSRKQFFEKLNLDKLTTVDEENLERISNSIKKMYIEEGRHLAKVSYEIIPDAVNDDKAKVLIKIDEGPKSKVVRVYFEGNKYIPSRKLRKSVFTRENWLLFFMDSAGQYSEEALEMDRHRLEYFYRDHGYLMVKVLDAKAKFSSNNKEIEVTFYIKEGDKFLVRNIDVHGQDGTFTRKELLERVLIKEGDPYSQSNLIKSINRIKNLWGEKGYIYSDVYPQIKPDEDAKAVDVTFHSEKGNIMHVNRINITGNMQTKDTVIRRQITLNEGDLITSKMLNQSQNNIEYLSFFARGGVNWNIHRITDELADLEMNVQEAKTGSLSAGLSYGSDQNSSKRSVKGYISVEKRNLFGNGWNVGGTIQGNRHRIQKLQANFFDAHFLDSDVSAAFDIYRKEEEYDQWKNLNMTPVEKIFGGTSRFGFYLPKIDKRLQFLVDFGVEDIRYNSRAKKLEVIGVSKPFLQPIIDRKFQQGTLTWLGTSIVKDTRNHQVYPNKGFRVSFDTKFAFPAFNDEFSFYKIEFESSWYTSLINDDTLVLALHGKMGTVNSFTDQKIIPYKELFHMGGQNTVRGFIWGGVGPALKTGDPLGGRHAVLFNAELLFPLIPDYSIKGHFFYDAGAGWDTPSNYITDTSMIKRNKFDLRHSVGFGLNLSSPVAAKIDWGYKLDRRRKEGESAHEFHLSMNHAW